MSRFHNWVGLDMYIRPVLYDDYESVPGLCARSREETTRWRKLKCESLSAPTRSVLHSRTPCPMYRKEVPQYGIIIELVAEVNAEVSQTNSGLRGTLKDHDEIGRLDVERDGPIRLGTEEELGTMR